MKLGIVGSRSRNTIDDYLLVCEKVLELQPDFIVSGGCKQGGDKFAEIIARELDIPPIIHHPKCAKNVPKYIWVKAAYDRNTLIAKDSDILIVLVSENRKGGTEDTISKFLLFNKEENLILL